MGTRARTSINSGDLPKKIAKTPEGRERQLVALAVDVAEKQLRDGTASAQVITHYLKLGTTREQLEQERLRSEIVLQQAKADALAAGGNLEALVGEAIAAFRSYSGSETQQENDRDYDD